MRVVNINQRKLDGESNVKKNVAQFNRYYCRKRYKINASFVAESKNVKELQISDYIFKMETLLSFNLNLPHFSGKRITFVYMHECF